MKRANRVLGLLVITAIVAASGCETDGSSTAGPLPSSTQAAEKPEPPFTSVWSAKQGVDLFSRTAELIRATQEALHLTQVYGPDNTFPGYLVAIGGPKDPERDPNYRFDTTSQIVGNEWAATMNSPMTNYYHIADLAVSPDQKGIAADVCSYSIPSPGNTTVRASIYHPTEVTHFELSNPRPDDIASSWPDGDAESRDSRAEMPPTWDVFGGWRIDRIDQLLPDKIPGACRDWWREERRVPEGGGPSQPPGNDSDVPLPREPVRAQYPEWIYPDSA